MTAIPDRNKSIAILGVIPRPAAEFSPFAITKSISRSRFKLGKRPITALRPGSPTISPKNKILITQTS